MVERPGTPFFLGSIIPRDEIGKVLEVIYQNGGSPKEIMPFLTPGQGQPTLDAHALPQAAPAKRLPAPANGQRAPKPDSLPAAVLGALKAANGKPLSSKILGKVTEAAGSTQHNVYNVLGRLRASGHVIKTPDGQYRLSAKGAKQTDMAKLPKVRAKAAAPHMTARAFIERHFRTLPATARVGVPELIALAKPHGINKAAIHTAFATLTNDKVLARVERGVYQLVVSELPPSVPETAPQTTVAETVQ